MLSREKNTRKTQLGSDGVVGIAPYDPSTPPDMRTRIRRLNPAKVI